MKDAPGAKAGKRRETYHTTREGNVEAIKREGFKLGAAEGGEFFGRGTYVHTNRAHSKEYTEGIRDFMYGDEVQVRTQVSVKKPFKIKVTNYDDDPAGALRNALISKGLIGPKDYPSASEVSALLRRKGYDAVQVTQSGGFNHDIAGSQMAVFDPGKVRIRPEFKTERVIKLKKGR